MIRTLIIDDEPPCVDRLRRLMEAHCPGLHLLAGCASAAEAMDALQRLDPELVFLDVQLGGDSGIDLLEALPHIAFEVIFTTAYDRYAVQAFRFSAMDFLLKPVEAAALVGAVAKLEHKRSREEKARQFETLFHNLRHPPGAARIISVPTVSGMVFLRVQEIIRCEASVNYTTLYLADQPKITVAKTLKEFEELLTPHAFCRVHNSHLINLACIRSYHRGKGGYVTLSDGSSVEVSSRRKEAFLRRLSEL